MKKTVACALACALSLSPVVLFAACAGDDCARNSYSITAEYFPEERKLDAKMTAHVSNRTENVLGALKFQLYPNAFREGAAVCPVDDASRGSVFYRGESFGGIEITAVEGAKSFEISGEDCNILSTELHDELYPDDCAELTLSFTVTLPQANYRFGAGEHCVNLANFYPVLCACSESGFTEYTYAPYGDPFVSECSDYDVTLTVPDSLTAVYGGAGECERRDGKNIYRVRAENVRDTAFVLGAFECAKGRAAGVDVEYYYVKDESPLTALSAAEQSLNYFSKTFGDYPYPNYKVVQTDLAAGGMEYPALSMISYDLKEGEIAPVVVHETAHQWWYSQVGSDQFDNAWQDEGLAEYSSALFFGEHPDYGVTYRDFVGASERAYRAFFSVYSQIKGDADTRMNRPLSSFESGYEYRSVAYDKGVILFDRVREVTGEKKFFSALKTYCKEYAGKIASPEEMIACFHRAGANVEGLFASFTEGKCVI